MSHDLAQTTLQLEESSDRLQGFQAKSPHQISNSPLKKAIDKQDGYKYYQSEWENLRFQSGDENEHLVLFVFPVLFEAGCVSSLGLLWCLGFRGGIAGLPFFI